MMMMMIDDDDDTWTVFMVLSSWHSQC